MSQHGGGYQFQIKPDGDGSRRGYLYRAHKEDGPEQTAEENHPGDIFVVEFLPGRSSPLFAENGKEGKAEPGPEVKQPGEQERVEVQDERFAQRGGDAEKESRRYGEENRERLFAHSYSISVPPAAGKFPALPDKAYNAPRSSEAARQKRTIRSGETFHFSRRKKPVTAIATSALPRTAVVHTGS